MQNWTPSIKNTDKEEELKQLKPWPNDSVTPRQTMEKPRQTMEKPRQTMEKPRKTMEKPRKTLEKRWTASN